MNKLFEFFNWNTKFLRTLFYLCLALSVAAVVIEFIFSNKLNIPLVLALLGTWLGIGIFSWGNNKIYLKIGNGEAVDLTKLPISTDIATLRRTFETLSKLEKKETGFFLVMTPEEKTVLTLSLFLMFGGIGSVIYSIAKAQFSDIVDNLSFFALGLTIFPLIEAQAKTRLSKKVAEIKVMQDKMENSKKDDIIKTLSQQMVENNRLMKEIEKKLK